MFCLIQVLFSTRFLEIKMTKFVAKTKGDAFVKAVNKIKVGQVNFVLDVPETQVRQNSGG